ncbi:MAG: (2Fe-2S)-binding protein [Myxococcota bacterium]|jgi:carbon-monoxide dehydrogenase small subunit|nr:(2Fe-2S)-binding protein [Myxococcota bacterium]
MTEHLINLKVNDSAVTIRVPAHRTLLELLRDVLGLTGTKEGCGNGECGACTVFLDGTPVRACLILAVEADGCEVQTIEGLSQGGLRPIQQAYAETGAVQCGFCTPGFVIAAEALLRKDPNPNDDAISAAFSGHICRCTGYTSLFEGVRLAAKKMRVGERE